jgi:purine-cytosine permease-like protein
MGVSTFALGALAVPVFGLGFVDALLTIFFINLLGVIPVCFFSIFGPEFGLRQIILSRFFFGYYGVKLGEAAPSTPTRAAANGYHQLLFSIALLVLAGPLSM